MFLQLSWKVRKSVFSPISLTEGLRPRPSWHASSVQQKKPIYYTIRYLFGSFRHLFCLPACHPSNQHARPFSTRPFSYSILIWRKRCDTSMLRSNEFREVSAWFRCVELEDECFGMLVCVLAAEGFNFWSMKLNLETSCFRSFVLSQKTAEYLS